MVTIKTGIEQSIVKKKYYEKLRRKKMALEQGAGLKSISDAVLSQQPSPKIFLQNFLSCFLIYLVDFGRDSSK